MQGIGETEEALYSSFTYVVLGFLKYILGNDLTVGWVDISQTRFYKDKLPEFDKEIVSVHELTDGMTSANVIIISQLKKSIHEEWSV